MLILQIPLYALPKYIKVTNTSDGSHVENEHEKWGHAIHSLQPLFFSQSTKCGVSSLAVRNIFDWRIKYMPIGRHLVAAESTYLRHFGSSGVFCLFRIFFFWWGSHYIHVCELYWHGGKHQTAIAMAKFWTNGTSWGFGVLQYPSCLLNVRVSLSLAIRIYSINIPLMARK